MKDKNGKLITSRITKFKTSNRSKWDDISKTNTYASQAVDPQIKQIFTKSAQDSLNAKQKLMSFLND